MKVFNITPCKGDKKPILISSPHSGTSFPEEVAAQLHSEYVKHPEDTDWFVDKLYDFAPDMGITVISANLSRYVIDLNRSPKNQKLYSDNRVQFDLVPTKSFALKDLYRDNPPSDEEIERRKKIYYEPYYLEVQTQLQKLKSEFGHALFFDAHSIKHQVAAIDCPRFPDLILGNQDGKTASQLLIETAVSTLDKNENYSFSHNSPFKGGQLTRNFGDPKNNIHALQLEMVQDVYMDEESTQYSSEKAHGIRKLLKALFENLTDTMEKL